jgi:ABC-type glycerol-3-phosphate transport system permease component
MRRVTFFQQILTQVILLVIGLFAILPLWGMTRIAFDGAIKGAPTEFRLIPKEFTLKVFEETWQKPSQALSTLALLKNSLVVAGGAALSAMVLGASMAYAFARFRFSGRRNGLAALLMGALLPPVALMTPLYILLSMLGIRTTQFGLVLVYTAFSMPFCIWNMRSAFQAVPRELEEAAFLDGAGRLVMFIKVILPLALPSIAVAALVAFLVGYSEFALGWLFVEKSTNVTLAMAVSGMLSYSGSEWPSLSAISLLMSVPVVVIFLFFHRYMLRGFGLGAVED